MREFQASITIDAPRERVWTVLVDTKAWPEWDPSCDRIEGAVAHGARIKAFSKLSPGRAFPLKVAELVPHERMIWTGGMPLGLFRGVRTFTLAPEKSGTQFALREVFSGPMLALIGSSLPDMTEAFQGFVRGLKRRSERAA
jgi:uncharacterized protein YndB with AHSA1/START domain